MVVLVPTRGRGDYTLREVITSFNETRTLIDTFLEFIVDSDDKTPHGRDVEEYVHYLDDAPGSMRAALNAATITELGEPWDIFGFIGDDHRFRTKGWDARIEEELKNGGMAYANDGVQGAALPTQWFVTTDIVRKLGWFALPDCNHFYLDNAWLDLANAAKCRHYLPDVIIEHMHFSYGKSQMDATYEHTMRVGSGDQMRYNNWRWSDRFEVDAYMIKIALGERNANPN